MTSIKETVGFLGRVILIRVGGLISDAAAQKVQSLEKELADMSSELESAFTAAEAFAERMERFEACRAAQRAAKISTMECLRAAEAELDRVRGALRMVAITDSFKRLNTMVQRVVSAALSSPPAPEAVPKTKGGSDGE